ncbi:MAG: type I 3-dehydroquinate dehydratase [Candidatus Lokiarchaeota archaeon]|nr:type I 3-dehydroquinate dehydratase [Candidatus Lokiarchaeota archaeon]
MICVAIPVKDISHLNEKFKELEYFEIDLVELRLDYLKELDFEQLKNVVSSSKIPLILTLRKKSEGGFFERDENIRVEFLKELITLKPEFIDLEYDSLNLDELLQFAKIKEVKTIISRHDFQKTPPFEECKHILQTMAKREADVLKYITTANDFQDNLIPINLINLFKGRNVVSFCMGKDGIFSRIFSILFGGYFTFASLEEKTAPGQISLEEMQDILIRFQYGE